MLDSLVIEDITQDTTGSGFTSYIVANGSQSDLTIRDTIFRDVEVISDVSTQATIGIYGNLTIERTLIEDARAYNPSSVPSLLGILNQGALTLSESGVVGEAVSSGPTIKGVYNANGGTVSGLLRLGGPTADFEGLSGVGNGSLDIAVSGDSAAQQIGDQTLMAGQRLLGFGGDDTLFASYGDDLIFGGDGDDSIRESYGDDTLFGGRGDDFIATTNNSGGAGPVGVTESMLFGGQGDDTLYAFSFTPELDATIAGGDGGVGPDDGSTRFRPTSSRRSISRSQSKASASRTPPPPSLR
ncbi:MAG: hypothetical protein AAFN79_19160 [Pseudomonadota bacterium]